VEFPVLSLDLLPGEGLDRVKAVILVSGFTLPAQRASMQEPRKDYRSFLQLTEGQSISETAVKNNSFKTMVLDTLTKFGEKSETGIHHSKG